MVRMLYVFSFVFISFCFTQALAGQPHVQRGAVHTISAQKADVAGPQMVATVAALHVSNQMNSLNNPGLLGYKEWREEKVRTVEQRIQRLKQELTTQSSLQGSQASRTQFLKRAATQEEWNLEVMRELSINDYFVLYLAPKTPSVTDMQNIAQKLTTDEVAQLLEAYSKSLFVSYSESPNVAPQLPGRASGQQR